MRLTNEEELAIWHRFGERYRFRPSVYRADWPGIAEPPPFKTFSIDHFYGAPILPAMERQFEELARRTFCACVALNDRLYALDWQHPSYWLYPHKLIPGQPWMIPAFPNGDYYIFIGAAIDFGWFGHPWERSICVFGKVALAALELTGSTLLTMALRTSV